MEAWIEGGGYSQISDRMLSEEAEQYYTDTYETDN
jgi:hypothetical protein